MIQYINLPYAVLNFKAHSKLKSKVLGAIEQIAPITISAPGHQIYKTDWNYPNQTVRPYVEIIHNDVSAELNIVFKDFGFDRYNVHNIWFQQYQLTDTHGWHTHTDCHYTCIYYVELPDGAPSTQFLDPLDNTTIFKIDIKEGDILIIPSMIKHRSPPVEHNVRKTIISFNASVVCDNAQ
jgi:cupin superfamily acireductone dioxygenase involved in methionine salvage